MWVIANMWRFKQIKVNTLVALCVTSLNPFSSQGSQWVKISEVTQALLNTKFFEKLSI